MTTSHHSVIKIDPQVRERLLSEGERRTSATYPHVLCYCFQYKLHPAHCACCFSSTAGRLCKTLKCTCRKRQRRRNSTQPLYTVSMAMANHDTPLDVAVDAMFSETSLHNPSSVSWTGSPCTVHIIHICFHGSLQHYFVLLHTVVPRIQQPDSVAAGSACSRLLRATVLSTSACYFTRQSSATQYFSPRWCSTLTITLLRINPFFLLIYLPNLPLQACFKFHVSIP